MAGLRTLKLTIEYDGTAYAGWQAQTNAPSVQEAVEEAIRRLTGEKLRIVAASRTDSGVHARGQVARLVTVSDIPADHFARALNSRLPEDIAIRLAEEVPAGFDPRREVAAKRYRYRIHASPIRPALERRFVWHVPWPLDRAKMAEAAAHYAGTHDFTSFTNAEYLHRQEEKGRAGRTGEDEPGSTVRTIRHSALEESGDEVALVVEGRSFLYNMVRNLAGTLVDVGRGRFAPAEIPAILAARDRKAAGLGAPPQGLCLEWIRYGDAP